MSEACDPDAEIEITPEMLAAGVAVAWRHDVEEDWAALVSKIYKSMRSSLPSNSPERGHLTRS